MRICSPKDIPPTLDLNRLSFFSRWSGDFTNVYEVDGTSAKTFCFGYWYPSRDFPDNRAVCVIEEHESFRVTTNSALWQISEMSVERQNGWLIFSRLQDELSMDDLDSFLTDSRNFLEHLRSEGKRFASEKN
jgi:hypothetical protein